MNLTFEQAMILFSLGLGVVIFLTQILIVASIMTLRNKLYRASTIVDSKFSEVERKITQLAGLGVTSFFTDLVASPPPQNPQPKKKKPRPFRIVKDEETDPKK